MLSRKLIGALLLFAGPALYAQVDTAAISDKLNKSTKQIGKDIVCLIQKDGKIIYKKENPDFTAKTQQGIGASSQWLTAALVMVFVQEGKLSLDDKVSDYLPFFTKYSKGYITIRHCLTHQTGVETDPGIIKIFQKSKYKTLEDEAMGIASRKEIETNPGTEFKYSNIGYSLVGRVLEVISKKGFDRLIQDKLLRPIGMRGTTFTNEDYNAATNPGFGARSTANDMTAFMTMLINKGKANNKQILTEESIETLLGLQAAAGQMKNSPKGMEGFGYTMGAWMLEANSANKASAVAAPSFSGSWPVVDLCRGYTLVLLTKDLSNPPAKEFYLDLKGIVDDGIPAKCN
ncbi:MAG TPA: serine hydrolase domain-containing protein [Chitinophagaceae bacterium]|nr:serine hydrolase domain-containing protein [Chitinophagaceae bacterium]